MITQKQKKKWLDVEPGDRVQAPHLETVAAAEHLRRVIARRRDRLVALQRGVYSTARATLIDKLAVDYDAVLAMALDAGASAPSRTTS